MIAAGVLMAGVTGITAAETVVQFDNTPSVHPQVHSRPADTETATGDTWNFSDTVAMVDGSEQDDETRSNLRIFGGMKTSWSPAADYSPYNRITGHSEFYQIQVCSDGNGRGGNATDTYQGILLWIKADFLNGADSKTVVFDESSSMKAHMFNSGEVRFVVNDGGTCYVSQKSTTRNNLLLNNPASAQWAVIDVSDYSFDKSAFGPHVFTDIQGAGLYLYRSSTGSQALYQMDVFEVNAALSN